MTPSTLRVFKDPPASEMVVLPRGQFMMGTEPGDILELFSALDTEVPYGGEPDEQPAHLVLIDYDLAMARYCVTFDEYDAYANATGKPLPENTSVGRANAPVVNVTWDDAMGYTKWLAEVTQKPYRLPSEAEWEYAARAATTTDYWWGDVADISNANYLPTPGCEAVSVNSLAPNPWGLYNMNGNVDEWVEDCFHECYSRAPADGSAWTTDYVWTAPDEDWARVIRGGNFLSDASQIRSAFRNRVSGSYPLDYVGFRVALTLTDG